MLIELVVGTATNKSYKHVKDYVNLIYWMVMKVLTESCYELFKVNEFFFASLLHDTEDAMTPETL